MTAKSLPSDHEAVTEKLRRHIRILLEIGRLAAQQTSLERFLDQVVVQVARAVEIDHVKVLCYRRKNADLIMAAGIGWKEGLVRHATFSSDLRSPPGRSFQTAEPITIVDFNKAADFIISETLKEHGIVSLANVPILLDGAAWGVLEVDSTTPRDFSLDTTEFLTAAAAVIGSMIRYQAEESVEVSEFAKAAAEAQRRETLLRELQHRVKNNFQLILSSIGMQKRRHPTPEVHSALDHVANRIYAVSLAHDQLAPRQDSQAVDVASYLRALTTAIEQQVDNIAFDIEADEIGLSLERAVPLGLILNEAVTNSAKHAFDDNGGRVYVKLQAGIGYGEGRLTIADNGRGMRDKVAHGSGLHLIDSLARHIGGQVRRESSDKGTSTVVTFPIIN